MKWKTSLGVVLDHTEMTDEHLRNAIAYIERDPNHNCRVVEELKSELSRRHSRTVIDQKSVCRYCGKETSICVYEDSYTDHGIGSFGTPNEYYFECDCGSRSPTMTWAELESRLNNPEQT